MHARLETREDLDELLAAGTVFDVVLHGQWVGRIAAAPSVQHGLRGAIVVELLLDPAVRGQGYGRHLSTLLAQQLQAPDDWFLLGTIRRDNTASYKSAIAVGRLDVGGDVIVTLQPAARASWERVTAASDRQQSRRLRQRHAAQNQPTRTTAPPTWAHIEGRCS